MTEQLNLTIPSNIQEYTDSLLLSSSESYITMEYLFVTLIFLPLVSALVSGLFGGKLGYKGSRIFSTTCVIISGIISVILFIYIMKEDNTLYLEFNLLRWLDIDNLTIDWHFRCDTLTISMLIPVVVISSLVHLYSIGYMESDPHQPRFFSYLSMFTFFMIILVTADNYLMLFVGWEFIGVASYLLISFWYTRLQAMKSALSAILLNRFGDTFLTIGLMATIWTFGTLDFKTIFSLTGFVNTDVLTFISICFLLGAMAKSAQLGPHIWLSLAMEGPTPVSALLHAATMVTAGVYLLMRSSPLLEYSSTTLLLCLWIGGLTTLVAGLIAIASNDIKRVIAYSTMSQLGMMVIAIGLSSYNMALFHLFSHAFFKALLFMSAGSIIHSIASESQDMRRYGGLLQFLPFTYVAIFIASLSLMAIPGLSGFYSKDIIIESAYGYYTFSGYILYWISVISATLTAGYSIRVLYLTFLSPPNSPRAIYTKVHESGYPMGIPMIILSVLSIFIGYITKDFFLGIGGNNSLYSTLFIHPDHGILADTEFGVPTFFKVLPLFTSVGLSIICFLLYEFVPEVYSMYTNIKPVRALYSFFNQKFYFDAILNNVILRSGLSVSGVLNKSIDKGVLQFIGPRGISLGLIKMSKVLTIFETGFVTQYALLFLASSLIIFTLVGYTSTYFIVLYIILILTPFFISKKVSS